MKFQCAACRGFKLECEMQLAANGHYICDDCLERAATPRETRFVGVIVSANDAVIQTPDGARVVPIGRLKGN